jgi:hypothetical protein
VPRRSGVREVIGQRDMGRSRGVRHRRDREGGQRYLAGTR